MSQNTRPSRLTNHELAERIDFAVGVLCDSLLELRKQQQELAARIAFVNPTESDITNEVQAFIDKALAA